MTTGSRGLVPEIFRFELFLLLLFLTCVLLLCKKDIISELNVKITSWTSHTVPKITSLTSLRWIVSLPAWSVWLGMSEIQKMGLTS